MPPKHFLRARASWRLSKWYCAGSTLIIRLQTDQKADVTNRFCWVFAILSGLVIHYKGWLLSIVCPACLMLEAGQNSGNNGGKPHYPRCGPSQIIPSLLGLALAFLHLATYVNTQKVMVLTGTVSQPAAKPHDCTVILVNGRGQLTPAETIQQKTKKTQRLVQVSHASQAHLQH